MLKNYFYILIMSLINSSCSVLTFERGENIPVFFNQKDSHTYIVEAYGKKEFFLWGLIKPNPNVDIEKRLKEKGVSSAANLKLIEYQSFQSFFFTLISFGLYYPLDYKIIVDAILDREHYFK